MKRITYSGGTLVTGNAVAAALLNYLTTVVDAENNATVDITVLEESGEITVHTLFLSPSTQLDVADAGGPPEADEEERFPVPELPQVGISATAETTTHGAEAAAEFDLVIREIDDGLGQ